MWIGTDSGMISQLQLTAAKSDVGLMYSIEIVQTLQLTPPHGYTPGTVTTAAAQNYEAAQTQLPTPFSQQPRLTLSSSASSYRGPDTTAGEPAVLNSLIGQAKGQLSRQPLASHPLLGPTPNDLGPPPRHPPRRAMSAELMHGNPQGSAPLSQNLSYFLRSGSTSLVGSPRQGQSQLPAAESGGQLGSGHLPATGLGPRQGSGLLPAAVLGQRQASGQLSASGPGQAQRLSPMRCTGSLKTSLGSMLPVSAGEHQQDAPVHAVAVIEGRVLTSTGPKASAVFREWSFDGMLLMTHLCCSLGKHPNQPKNSKVQDSAFPF